MKKILVIDEDEHVRYSFRRILEAEYEIVESGSGLEALSKVKDSVPDLVLMDVRAPKRSDLEMFERIRGLSPDLPIIVMSSYGNQEAKRQILELGANSFVLKPFDIEELRELVGHTLAASSVHSPSNA